MAKGFWAWVLKNEWLLVVLTGVVILRVPTLFEPYWYGDEGIYLVIGKALNLGARLYRDIHDNKPPLLYLMAALAGGNQFWFRMIALVWNTFTVGVFAGLAGKLLGQARKREMIVATVAFGLLTNLPLLEGNIANAELFFLLPTVAAARILVDEKVNYKRIALAGMLIGLGGLFKIPAMLEAGIWPIVWWRFKEKSWFGKSLVLGTMSLTPLLISIGYFASQGVGQEYLIAAGLQNVPYLASWQAGSGTGIFTLAGRAAILMGVITGLVILAKEVGRRGLIIGLWGGLIWFAMLLSGRPYPHYILQGAGLLAIAGAVVLWGRKIERLIGFGVIGGIVVSALTFGFYHYRSVEYYKNFASWALGKQSREEYYAWFSPQVKHDYNIAETILAGSDEKDGLFVWGDEPMIYALTGKVPPGKYTVKYHVLDFRAQGATIQALRLSSPKYIVSFGREEELPGLGELLSDQYMTEKELNGARIYRRLGEKYN